MLNGFRPSSESIPTRAMLLEGNAIWPLVASNLPRSNIFAKHTFLKKIGNQTLSMTSETLIKECSGHRMMIGADSR
jgi:hypothetical protein